jgi:hypothetical protein
MPSNHLTGFLCVAQNAAFHSDMFNFLQDGFYQIPLLYIIGYGIGNGDVGRGPGRLYLRSLSNGMSLGPTPPARIPVRIRSKLE